MQASRLPFLLIKLLLFLDAELLQSISKNTNGIDIAVFFTAQILRKYKVLIPI